MPTDDNLTRHRRLKGHDYSIPGYYFITFNTWDRLPHLGRLDNGKLHALPIGAFLQREIAQIPASYPHVSVDCHAIMPDHVHVLIYISIESVGTTISDVVRTLKGRSSAAFRKMVPESGGKLWQPGFDDQIIRNDKHLENVRRYIAENPVRPKDGSWW